MGVVGSLLCCLGVVVVVVVVGGFATIVVARPGLGAGGRRRSLKGR